MSNERLSGEDFDRIVEALKLDSPSIPACRLVLVKGQSINSAARKCDVDPGAVHRMLKKIPRILCRECGQPIREK